MTSVARLQYAGGQEWQWQQLGACRGVEESRFFHPDNERGTERERREAGAKRVCATCPVLELCREHALRVREPYGVWGGLGEGERRHILVAQRAAGPHAVPGEG